MKTIERQNKESRITLRLNKTELDTLNAKVAEAGYKSAGAFIRDFVANG
jgi:predicted DNA binding CopG/RHH family protein